MNVTKQKGFSLVELLIVVGIIGVLTTVILAATAPARSRARDARHIANVKQIKTALEDFFSVCYQYPTFLSHLNVGAPYCPSYKPVFTDLVILTGGDYTYKRFEFDNDTFGQDPGKSFHICRRGLENPVASSSGKAGRAKVNSSDLCDGTNPNVFDLVGGAL